MLKEEELFLELTKLNKKRDKLNQKINKVYLELREICTHSKTKEYSYYEEGDYYSRSKYHRQVKCEFCGEIIKDDITYGGYG